MTPLAVGFSEMWQPVYRKYRPFFDALPTLQSAVNEITQQPVTGPLQDIVCRLIFAAANTYGALLTLVLNGYGHDAMKLARSIYEIEVDIIWLKNHPDDVEDFVDYNIIQQKQYYDAMDEELQKQVPAERYQQMMMDYERVLPRFATTRDKNRPRNEWCRVSFYDRAKEAEQHWRQQFTARGEQVKEASLYKAFYRPASSMHHGDIGGLIAQLDSDTNVEMAPCWSWLEDALVGGLGSLVRSLNYFNEIGQFGFKNRLENGPNEEYVRAVRSLP